MRAAAARRRRRKGPVAGPASMIRVGRSLHYAGLWPGRSGARAAFLATGPTAWYDARDLLSTSQTTLPNRVGTGTATLTNGVLALPGSGYVYLPGTASNNLSVTKGAWGGTLHVTATLVDNTTATYTTTADPVLIGNTLLAAGRYKRFDLRENDANGAIHTTINLQTDTLGQATFTCSTGQTVTVNRSSSGYTTVIVDRPLIMTDGSNDFLQLPAGDAGSITATTGAYTALVVMRRHVTYAANQALFSSESVANQGFRLFIGGTTTALRLLIGGSLATPTITLGAGTAPSDGTLFVAAGGASSGTARVWSSVGAATTTGSITTVGTISVTSPKVPVRSDAGVDYSTGAFGAVVVYNGRALSTTELAAAATHLTGTYS